MNDPLTLYNTLNERLQEVDTELCRRARGISARVDEPLFTVEQQQGDKLVVATNSLVFTKNHDKWGIYIEVSPGEHGFTTRTPVLQGSLEQRIAAGKAIGALLTAVNQAAQESCMELHSAIDKLDDCLEIIRAEKPVDGGPKTAEDHMDTFANQVLAHESRCCAKCGLPHNKHSVRHPFVEPLQKSKGTR